MLQSDINGNVKFTGIAAGTFSYSAELACYQTSNDSVTVASANVFDSISLSP